MLAAVVAVSGVLDPDRFTADMEASFKHKFATKPQVIDGNMNCLRHTMEEIAKARTAAGKEAGR